MLMVLLFLFACCMFCVVVDGGLVYVLLFVLLFAFC